MRRENCGLLYKLHERKICSRPAQRPLRRPSSPSASTSTSSGASAFCDSVFNVTSSSRKSRMSERTAADASLNFFMMGTLKPSNDGVVVTVNGVEVVTPPPAAAVDVTNGAAVDVVLAPLGDGADDVGGTVVVAGTVVVEGTVVAGGGVVGRGVVGGRVAEGKRARKSMSWSTHASQAKLPLLKR